MYYAQAWSLALNGIALFEDDFEAWAHGPVLPKVYKEYKDYGLNELPSSGFEINLKQMLRKF